MFATVRPFLLTIFLSLAALVAYLLGMHTEAGGDSPLWHAFTYQICHCNVWHLIGNLYCAWYIAASNYRVGYRRCIIAYAISLGAVFGPPTQGLSGILYALVGMLSWQASRIRGYHLIMLAFLSLGLLFPHCINIVLHLFCYLGGVGIEMLFFPWRERLKKYWR